MCQVATLIGSSPILKSVTLTGCQLPSEAGLNIADGVRLATEQGFPLSTLELQSNKLESVAGHALASSLAGNCALIDLKTANNPMDKEAQDAVKEALGRVQAAWRKTDEGKAQAKSLGHRKSDANSGGLISDLMNLMS